MFLELNPTFTQQQQRCGKCVLIFVKYWYSFVFQAEDLSDKWDLLTKKTFGFLLRDGTSKHGEENPAWDILPVDIANHASVKDDNSQNDNGNTHHTPEHFGFIEINKKPDKFKADHVLESVEKDENLDGKQNIFEPPGLESKYWRQMLQKILQNMEIHLEGLMFRPEVGRRIS